MKRTKESSLKQERGAALVTVLLISTLLVVTGGALVLVTGLSTRTAIDATSEMQAYYAAESGIQDTLNVLRGNVNPVPTMPGNSKIDFLKAITPNDSNRPGDSTGLRHLSGWLNYNVNDSNGRPDRVALTANYTSLNGLAYSVEVSDPDVAITPANTEPQRLLLRVRGFGPKSAEKRLEAIVTRTNFDYAPPAMLLMRGAQDCSAMHFTIGDSNPKDYSGHDRAGTGILPSFGATCDSDTTIEVNSDDKNTVANPKAQTVADPSLPPWLRSADEARAFLLDEKESAINQGRYFTSYDGYSGTAADPAFTFVDGDCVLDGGGGLLIVTGNLTLHGNPAFEGLILVLGGGQVIRDGGGNGDIYGAISIAKFNVNGNGGFQTPYFDTSGGGTSLMQYDSNAVRRALNVSGPRVMGIHEQ